MWTTYKLLIYKLVKLYKLMRPILQSYFHWKILILSKSSSKFGIHAFSSHNSAICGQFRLNFAWDIRETFFYRLCIWRNPWYHYYFPILIFWIHFGGKIGIDATPVPKSLVLQNPTKKLTHNVCAWTPQLLPNHKNPFLF